MSVINTAIIKQPIKVIEVPLNKFTEEVIPHHQKTYEEHKKIVLKFISLGNIEQAEKINNDKKRVIKQLKDLMYELDTLRTQVEDCDLDKFDSKTLVLRKIILNLINGYTDLQKLLIKANSAKQAANVNELEEEKEVRLNPFEGAPQIQLQANVDDLKLLQKQVILNRIEEINRDAEDLHDMYSHLNTMVYDQKEDVERVEDNVESSSINVNSGLKNLIQAHKLKAAAYPVTGAFLGTIIGGPIGLIAGLKVGGLAAVGCAIAGYTGGKFFHKVYDVEEKSAECTDENTVNDTQEKKDM